MLVSRVDTSWEKTPQPEGAPIRENQTGSQAWNRQLRDVKR